MIEVFAVSKNAESFADARFYGNCVQRGYRTLN